MTSVSKPLLTACVMMGRDRMNKAAWHKGNCHIVLRWGMWQNVKEGPVPWRSKCPGPVPWRASSEELREASLAAGLLQGQTQSRVISSGASIHRDYTNQRMEIFSVHLSKKMLERQISQCPTEPCTYVAEAVSGMLYMDSRRAGDARKRGRAKRAP